MDKQPGSWIYILFSSSDFTRCKIGKTINNPLIRYRQLRTGDPYLAFKVGYYIPDRFGSISSFETAIHSEFGDERLDTHGDTISEWFILPAKEAEFLVDCKLKDWTGQEVFMSTTFHCDKLIKMYEDDIQSTYSPTPYDVAFINEIMNAKDP